MAEIGYTMLKNTFGFLRNHKLFNDIKLILNYLRKFNQTEMTKVLYLQSF